MLKHLFARLTPSPVRGEALFGAISETMRRPHWYLAGGVVDDLDGRFRVLATLCALAIVRLERDGAEGEAVSVALTERFVEVMEAEHRELGLGDPGLGKKVRELVGALSRRVGLWRGMSPGTPEWSRATADSLSIEPSGSGEIAHSAGSLHAFRDRLEALDLSRLEQGEAL
jgi:cytochrome b pre-mRNA-processing protein 3